MLEKLDLYGLESVEDLVCVGLITQDPVLIVANAGAAKTALINRIGVALDIKSGVINAHTSDQQDWVGIPLPQKDGDNYTSIKMIPTPQSIVDLDLLGVDEISRVDLSNQSKMFSLIQSREVDGVKMKFKYLFAMMNPPSGSGDFIEYEGSESLEYGLAARFSLFLQMPELNNMKATTIRQVARASMNRGVEINEFDEAHSFEEMTEGENLPGRDDVDPLMAQEFRDFVSGSRAKFLEYMADEERVNVTINYVSRFSVNMREHKKKYVPIDGRRIGMIARAIIALQAIYAYRGIGSMDKAAELVMTHSYPNIAIGREFDPDEIEKVHSIVARETMSTKSALVEEIMSETDLVRRIGMAMRAMNLGVTDTSRIVREAIEKAGNDAERMIIAMRLFNPVSNMIDAQTLAELANTFRPLLSFDCELELKGDLDGIEIAHSAMENAAINRVLPHIRAVAWYATAVNGTPYYEVGSLIRSLELLDTKVKEAIDE